MTLRFFPATDLTSWGRVAREKQLLACPEFQSELLAWSARDKGPRLAIGLQRSYGDTALFSNGRLICMRKLDRFLGFNTATGIVKAQAGLALGGLLKIAVPAGWFLPVTPGTRHVTLAGALANDVHGKNHAKAGSFGRHVTGFTLLRSDRGRLEVRPDNEPDLFAATIGGLGLTGVILDVTLQLAPLVSAYLNVETIAVGDLDELLGLNAQSVPRFEHSLAWIDAARRTARIGMGVYSRANWAPEGGLDVHRDRSLAVPAQTPGVFVNRASISAFNRAYRAAQLALPARRQMHYSNFLYKLDGVAGWNKLYGAAGLYQYQCVTPLEHPLAVREILDTVCKSTETSAMVVLKSFGELPSRGLLSFPRPGFTLALDFRNRGQPTQALLSRLDDIVREAKGALYPAKDGRMTRSMFELSYPGLERFLALRDPACRSDFSARLGL